jgi:aspartyl-tRNA(Asn)/glutamyl-tRNA(Gln) amidotransferase subunit A
VPETIQTLAAAARAIRAGHTTSVALIESSLKAIEQWQTATNAFTRVDAEGAREAARAADRELERGVNRGPLHGSPISIKDLIDVAGQPTTAGSRVLSDHIASRDAPVIARLREAGAVFIGRTNLHEFALGTTSEDSAFGPVRNPRDRSRSAGGSSGGSAAAVATGMGLASIGTDTGGSIRIPAAACGVVGLKPSIGEVPTEGVVPLSPSLDHVGPIARTVEDAAWLWALLAAAKSPMPLQRETATLRLVRVGGRFDLVEPDVRRSFDQALHRLHERGVFLTSCDTLTTDALATTYVHIVLSEAAAWHAAYLDSRGQDYTPTVRARLESGREISAVDYLRARDQQTALRRAVDAALEGADALVLPTLPIVAPLLGADEVTLGPPGTERVAVRAAMLRHTHLFNLTGHPAISLPIPGDGLPVGLQLVGRLGRTPDLLAVAAACEQALK